MWKKKKLLKPKHLSTDNLSKVPQISPMNETIIRMGGGAPTSLKPV